MRFSISTLFGVAATAALMVAGCGSGATDRFDAVAPRHAMVTQSRLTSCASTVKSTYKLYVADVGKILIVRFSPPNPSPTTVNVLGAAGTDVKFDTKKNMWVDETSRNSIHGFAPPYNGTPFAATVAPMSNPFGIAFDSADQMFVANTGDNMVGVLNAPFTGNAYNLSIAVSGPAAVAFDSACDLFVAGSGTLTEFAPPYSSPTFARAIPGANAVAVDASQNLFVGTFGQKHDIVEEFAPPYTGAPVAKISYGVATVAGLAFDASGDLFVSNEITSSITEYKPPFTGKPALRLSKNLTHQEGITFGPP